MERGFASPVLLLKSKKKSMYVCIFFPFRVF